jgi:hypothetical protein
VTVPFTLDLHPDAARNFDGKAEALLALVCAVRVAGQGERAFRPDIHPFFHFTEKDIIGEIEVSTSDYRGRQTGRMFDRNGKPFGLVGKDYRDLEALAARLQQVSTIRPHISIRCLTNSAFNWLKKRHRGETEEPFTGFVLRECASLVQDSEIWVPLFNVSIQSEFSVGRIKFKTLTREMFDSWLERMQKNVPQERQPGLQVALNRTRSRLQGHAAATTAVTAEPLRAQELAGEEAEYSIAALRFFHFANMTPYARSYCTFAGSENLPASSTLTVRSGMIEQWQDSAFPAGRLVWELSDQDIREFRDAGLDALSQVLTKDKRSPFENELLDAILIYSRNSLLNDVASRLIYILAGIESVLLRDNNEPIQKNIGERLAFIVGRTPDERMSVRDSLTRAYRLRSAFLHHGRALDEMDALEVFMRHVWRGFLFLIQNKHRFHTKQDLIEALERRKME